MAIQAYERCRAVLADQLDAQPSEETQRLLNEIRSAGPAVTPLRPEPRPEARPEPRPEVRSPRNEPREFRNEARTNLPRGGARVGVMPLQMVNTTEEEAHLSTGLADEITSALARFRWMFVVSSSSLARFAAGSRDETAIRRNFNIDFLLDGTIQRTGARLRIGLRLLDLRAGNQMVWARRFDRDSNDLLTLQDDIAAEVVAQIDPQLLLIEGARLTARPPHDASAYDLVLRSIPLISRLDRPQFMEAGDLLARAIALEPDYAAAHAWYAYWHVFLVGQHWTQDRAGALAEAGRLAERAVTLDPQDARALTIAGHVRAFLHHRVHEAVALHARAMMLNPNLAMAWAMSAVAHTYLGDLATAKAHFARHKQLSPYDPQAFFFDGVRIIIGLLEHNHAAAVAAGREVSQMNPAFSSALKPYLSALGHSGPEAREEAQAVRARLLAMEPDFTIARWLAASPWHREADRAHFAEGLRRAGVPE
jgi:TolB-like protein